jgi:spore maturation protein CgeB
MRIVLLGLSVTSSWGNGHATNYRALMRAMVGRGHDVLFLERDVPWYAAMRDLPSPPWGRTELYADVADLRRRFHADVAAADLVIVGSYVPDGVAVGEWVVTAARGVRAFYDIDTPITLANLAAGRCEYLDAPLVPRFDLYLSFTGGPTLQRLEQRWGAARAVAFHCLVDPEVYAPTGVDEQWVLGYLGTYSDDRQPALDELLVRPAQRLSGARFVVAGPQYPADITWPANVERIEHVAPDRHARFYGGQRFTLNVTRADMVAAGWSPSVRLFEAAACATPIISDWWDGLDAILTPGTEVMVARRAADVIGYLVEMDDTERRALGCAARRRILAGHTATHRVRQLESLVGEAQRSEAAS